MGSYTIHELHQTDFPPLLREIPQPPKALWYAGTLPPPHLTLLTVVGSRAYTSYGKQVVNELIEQLKDYPLGIVSGLALGIDSLAHEAALRHSLYTLAVPGSGLSESVLYPVRHRNLARTILSAGGGLLSELSPDTPAAKWTFIQRNRIMAGMCHATLLIEATEKSGTLVTARMAVDYNRELLVVPGSIFSAQSVGVHQFLKLGATPVTCGTDIADVLGLTRLATPTLPLPQLSQAEQRVLALLVEPTNRDTLIRALNQPIHEVATLLTQMELQGYIAEEAGVYRARLSTLSQD